MTSVLSPLIEKIFYGGAFTAYSVGMSLFLGYALTRREQLALVGKWTLEGAVGMHVVSLLIRTFIGRQMPQHDWYVPWSNWFESFSFFAAVIATEYLIIQRGRTVPILGAFVTPLVFLVMLVAIHSPFGMQIPMLVPALQSHWMAFHVPVMFIAYAAFTIAFAVGLAYLLQERQLKLRKPSHLMFRLPPLDELDQMIFRIIFCAFPILTMGLFLGALWAHDVWGRYWGWDAKETWAFITWLVYWIYLFMRIMKGWRGRKTAYLSLAGFALVIFTYAGVNYFSQLHGFLSSAGR